MEILQAVKRFSSTAISSFFEGTLPSTKEYVLISLVKDDILIIWYNVNVT